MTQTRQAYTRMFESVKRCRLLTVKKEKRYTKFHRFSIEEGFEMCRTCDKALNLEGPEIFWQLLIEKEFIGQLTSELQAADSSSSSSEPCSSRTLSHVEENAVRYTARYVVRKLEQKYTKRDTQEAVEHVAALREMAGRLNPTATPTEHRSSEWTKLVDRGGLYYVENVVYDL